MKRNCSIQRQSKSGEKESNHFLIFSKKETALLNRRKTLPYSQECTSLSLPAHQIQLQERTLIPARTPLLPPQKQSNAARQTTLPAISPRILDIEGEIEPMRQEGSLTASLVGNSGRGKKQTLHTINIEAMRRIRVVLFFHRLCILMVCPEYMHGMTQQHGFDAVATKRVKSSLCMQRVRGTLEFLSVRRSSCHCNIEPKHVKKH
jgi:hypothetical protein